MGGRFARLGAVAYSKPVWPPGADFMIAAQWQGEGMEYSFPSFFPFYPIFPFPSFPYLLFLPHVFLSPFPTFSSLRSWIF